MAKIQIANIVVHSNPSPFLSPIQFEITFDCLDYLQADLEWKLIYVGSSNSEQFDQVLDTVLIGPSLPVGRHVFVFEANPPDVAKIPVGDLVDVTVILLTCSYRDNEFVQVGYYVNNEYRDSELLLNPPLVPLFDQIYRDILATNPRITKQQIDWNDYDNDKEMLNENDNGNKNYNDFASGAFVGEKESSITNTGRLDPISTWINNEI